MQLKNTFIQSTVYRLTQSNVFFPQTTVVNNSKTMYAFQESLCMDTRLKRIPFVSWSWRLTSLKFRIQFLLEYIKVIDCCQGNNIILRMPGGVEDLSAEVQAVHPDLVPLTPASRAHPPGLEGVARGAVFPGGLQCQVLLGVAIKHPEEVVVGACHDLTVTKRKMRVNDVQNYKHSSN